MATLTAVSVPACEGVSHLGVASCGDSLGDVTIAHLAALYRDPGHFLREVIEAECAQGCGAKFACERWAAPRTSCDACRKQYLDNEAMERAKKHWESICPGRFRETDRNHVDFPRAQFNQLRDWQGQYSLFFYGDTGTGKTRLAFWLLKRAMLRGNAHVGVVWPRELKDAAKGYDQLQRIEAWARYDVLLLDDPFRDGVNDRVMSLLVDLIDLVMNHKKRIVVTSQLNGEDCYEQADKYLDIGRKPTETDIKRLDALWRRLREECKTVPFVKQGATVPVGETAEVF